IGPHEQRLRRYVADHSTGSDGDLVFEVGERGGHHRAVGEIENQWAPGAGQLSHSPCRAGVFDAEIRHPAPDEWVRGRVCRVPVFGTREQLGETTGDAWLGYQLGEQLS